MRLVQVNVDDTTYEKLAYYLDAFKASGIVITNLESLIEKETNVEQREHYTEQMIAAIKEWDDSVTNLKTYLKAIIDHEKDQNLPINISYRKLYSFLIDKC